MNGKDYLETVRFKTLEVLEQNYYAYDIIAAFEAGQKDEQKSVKEYDSLPCVRMRDLYGELREMGLNSELADNIIEWSKTL